MKNLFISYSHKDVTYRDELTSHLKGLLRAGFLSTWSDKEIIPGQDWEQEIIHNAETADIIVLLISSDFLNSKYIYEKEFAMVLERLERGEVTIIPIIARPCHWEDEDFSKFQILPSGGKPIALWDNMDAAYTDIVKGIKRSITKTSKGFSEPPYIDNDVEINENTPVADTIRNISEIVKNLTAPKKNNKNTTGHNPNNIFGSWQLVEIKQNNHNLSIPMMEVSVFHPNYTFQVFQNNVQVNYGHFAIRGSILNLTLFNGLQDVRSFYTKGNQLVLHHSGNNVYSIYQRSHSR